MFRRTPTVGKANTRGDGFTAEPSEIRFRNFLLVLGMLVGPPLLFFIYYKKMFLGLTNGDALDLAQIGRNMADGRGFVTFILRPLALTHGSNPLQQPDVTHGPLYPFLLALAFGVLGTKDSVVAAVSGLFYLLTIPTIYLLGARVFNRTVGRVAALIVIFNPLLLEYAISGTYLTLYIFLMTILLLSVYSLATIMQKPDRAPNARLPRVPLVLTGLLTGLLYLTDPIFFWILPVIAGAVFWLSTPRRAPAMAMFLLPLSLLVLPWMARNALLTGNPIFGLRGMEFWMNTRNHYPEFSGYRVISDDIAPNMALFKDVLLKLLWGIGQVIKRYPEIAASWVLAFFLPSLLFRFTDLATNTLRRVMLFCLLAILTGSLLFRLQLPLLVAVMPTMLIFSVAYLQHLIQQAQLPRPSVLLLSTLIVLSICVPLFSDMMLSERIPRLREVDAARSLEKNSKPADLCLSDQPWIVAWYANRPCLWIPAKDKDVGKISGQYGGARWLLLTEQSSQLSPAWQYIYGVFRQWNTAYVLAKRNGNLEPPAIAVQKRSQPVSEVLDGFTVFAPENMEVGTVLAGRPSS